MEFILEKKAFKEFIQCLDNLLVIKSNTVAS